MNGPQISAEGACILTAETERRHIGMTGRQAVAQALHERIEVEPAIEIAKRRRTNMRALIGAADGMATGAHPFGERLALPNARRKFVRAAATD